MQKLMQQIYPQLVTGWSGIRILRLVLGVTALIQGYQMAEWVSAAIGIVLLYQVVTNTGCCGSTACYGTLPDAAEENSSEIKFTEITENKSNNT